MTHACTFTTCCCSSATLPGYGMYKCPHCSSGETQYGTCTWHMLSHDSLKATCSSRLIQNAHSICASVHNNVKRPPQANACAGLSSVTSTFEFRYHLLRNNLSMGLSAECLNFSTASKASWQLSRQWHQAFMAFCDCRLRSHNTITGT